MITIEILYKKVRISQVTVKGHANYAEYGKDIVCAAVSAVTIGTVNAIEQLLNVSLLVEKNEKHGGLLAWQVPEVTDERIADKMELLLNAFVLTIKSIRDEYKEHLQVREIRK